MLKLHIKHNIDWLCLLWMQSFVNLSLDSHVSSHLREVCIIFTSWILTRIIPEHDFRALVQKEPAHIHAQTFIHPAANTYSRRLGPGGQKLLLSGLVYTGSRCCWDCMSATPYRERSGGTLGQHIRGVNNLQSVTHATHSRLEKKSIYQCKSTNSQNLTSLFFRDADAEREEKVQM